MAVTGSYVNTTTKTGANDVAPKYTAAKPSSTLEMDDFLLLLATQLQNQDMSNPMSNSEMMNQLTSMATIQAMSTMTDLSTSQYGLSMMGKEVTVNYINASGKLETHSGIISGVDMVNMKIYLEGDKTAYGFGNIMQIGKVPKQEEETKPEEGGTTPAPGEDDKKETETADPARMRVMSNGGPIPDDKLASLKENEEQESKKAVTAGQTSEGPGVAGK